MFSSLDNTPTTPPGDPQSTPENPLLRPSNPLVSNLEQDVLDEYTRLLGNVNKVCVPIAILSIPRQTKLT